jgi:hypothetical protein
VYKTRGKEDSDISRRTGCKTPEEQAMAAKKILMLVGDFVEDYEGSRIEP